MIDAVIAFAMANPWAFALLAFVPSLFLLVFAFIACFVLGAVLIFLAFLFGYGIFLLGEHFYAQWWRKKMKTPS